MDADDRAIALDQLLHASMRPDSTPCSSGHQQSGVEAATASQHAVALAMLDFARRDGLLTVGDELAAGGVRTHSGGQLGTDEYQRRRHRAPAHFPTRTFGVVIRKIEHPPAQRRRALQRIDDASRCAHVRSTRGQSQSPRSKLWAYASASASLSVAPTSKARGLAGIHGQPAEYAVVPPNTGARSSSVTCAPARAADDAAHRPAAPLPTTTTRAILPVRGRHPARRVGAALGKLVRSPGAHDALLEAPLPIDLHTHVGVPSQIGDTHHTVRRSMRDGAVGARSDALGIAIHHDLINVVLSPGQPRTAAACRR